jgi:hypothetical protein
VILRRILFALMAATAFCAAAGVTVFGLAFALYALVEPCLGRAGAAATVAGATVALMLLAGLAMRGAGRKAKPADPYATSFIDRGIAFVREKPILAIAGALGAGLMAIRNPKYLGAVLRAFLEGKPPKR